MICKKETERFGLGLKLLLISREARFVLTPGCLEEEFSKNLIKSRVKRLGAIGTKQVVAAFGKRPTPFCRSVGKKLSRYGWKQ